MSRIERDKDELALLGDNHTPAPPADGGTGAGTVPVTTLGDNHTPAPPADGGIRTLGDNHTPAPPRD
ncbi:hypothetical protein [Streptomyces sp. NPDC090026]|uniref:hypothetical protein n=1 Tax=Streptomyces sp. NPDC090026 TaxID=3365923 RepID=UPI0037F87A5E